MVNAWTGAVAVEVEAVVDRREPVDVDVVEGAALMVADRYERHVGVHGNRLADMVDVEAAVHRDDGRCVGVAGEGQGPHVHVRMNQIELTGTPVYVGQHS